MRLKQLFTFLALTLMVACSTDNDEGSLDDNQLQESDLLGVWGLSDVRLEEGQNDAQQELYGAILDQLVKDGCYLLRFNFMSDGKVDIESKAKYLELEGLQVPCPEQSETEAVEWQLDDDQLSLTDGDMQTETITISFEDKDTFIIDGSAVGEEQLEGAIVAFRRL